MRIKMLRLHVALENEAMQTPDQVARVMHAAADRVGGWVFISANGTEYPLTDENGNTVGGFKIEEVTVE